MVTVSHVVTTPIRGQTRSRPSMGRKAPARTELPLVGSSYRQQADLDSGDEPMKYIVGLDYGTTFTSVSYSIHPIGEDNPQAFPWEVMSIINWPHDLVSGGRKQVPTESWYASTPMERDPQSDDEQLEEVLYDPDEVYHPLVTTSPKSNDNQNGDMDFLDDAAIDDDQSTEFLWGYAVPYQLYGVNTTRSPRRRIKRPKLMLVNTPYTKGDRDELRPIIDMLVREGIIRKYGKKGRPDSRDILDIITDFLIKVFQHTKQQLTLLHSFSDQCPVEFSLTVPTIWSPKASRILQTAARAAIQATGFGAPADSNADDLFIISEPEAAATYLLVASNEVMAGETFIIADCGGGTYVQKYYQEIMGLDGEGCFTRLEAFTPQRECLRHQPPQRGFRNQSTCP